jgi:hypothetical protein
MRTLASCAARVFEQPLVARLRLLCDVLDAFERDADAMELNPECVLLTESLEFAMLASQHTPLPVGPDVIVTARHRFSPPEALRGEAEHFSRARRGALLVLYLLSDGAEVPYADCHTIEQLLKAPSLELPALPCWAACVSECAVVDTCLHRREIMSRPYVPELEKAVRGLLWAAEGRETDPESADLLLPFGGTELERERRIKQLLLESLVPRNALRVGGLRRMNRVFLDCAVTTMLCLKRRGLNRDAAFMIVQRTIEMQPRCARVASDVDLSKEKRFELLVQEVTSSLFSDNSIVSYASEFDTFSAMLRLGRFVGPEWVFDLARTLEIPNIGRACVGTRLRHDGGLQMVVSFNVDNSWEYADSGTEEYAVMILPGGKFAAIVDGSGASPCSYSSLFRAAVYRWHRFNCVLSAGGIFSMKEGPAILVDTISVHIVKLHHFARVKFVIKSNDGTKWCFAVQEDSFLFFVPSVERDGQPYAFKTLHELVRHYQRELAWLQSDSEDVPPECAWLSSMFNPDEEIVL